VDTVEDLPEMASIDDSYIVVDNEHLYIWDGGVWVDNGLIQITGQGCSGQPIDFESPIDGGPPTSGIDRRGKDFVSIQKIQKEPIMPMMFRTSVLNALNKNQVIDSVEQQESVSFNITWAEGSGEGKND
jgi:hypothetical protein